MKLTGEQIRLLLRRKETERVEFKRAATALPTNFWDSYNAFCNTDGGVIILGVAQDKSARFSIEGVRNAQKLMSDFWSTANNAEKVSYSIFFGHYVYPVKCSGKTLVVIEVPRAPREARPVYIGEDVFKGTFRRNGEGDYHCTREAVKAMLRDQCDGYAEPTITESYDPDRTVITVTTDDDTVNETVIVLKPDQNPTRNTPKTVQKQSENGVEAVQKLSDDGTGTVQKSSADGAEAVQKQSLKVDVARPPLNELSTSARQVLNAIADDCFMTQRGLVSKIGLAKSTIIKATAILIKNGYLRRVGPKKGGHWEVVEGSGE